MGDDWWDDFTNNLATDFAPLVALFGEQPTKQYLSECLTATDIFIFATAPLGVITAIVSAIRVCGTPSLRAFIGRAQEGAGNAEAELCSSTSRDVCELYNNGGIARVFGRPKILEIVHDSKASIEDFFAEQGSRKPTAGIYTFKDFKNKNDGQHVEWTEAGRSALNPQKEQQSSELQDDFPPNPNLSLNVGIKPRSQFWFYAAAVLGCVLQSAVLVWAAVARYQLNLVRNDVQDRYAVQLTVAGTLCLGFGVGLCAFLVERSTKERVFLRTLDTDRAKPPNRNGPESGPRSRMYWVQPGNQVIGDQVFDSFAYTDLKAPLRKYTTSLKPEKPGDSIVPTMALVWGAVLSTLFGFVLQFIGLRACHSSVSLAQLCTTVAMSIVRALLRTQRMEKKDNMTKDATLFQGHELDWLALEMDLPTEGSDTSQPRRHLWNVLGHKGGDVQPKNECFKFQENGQASEITRLSFLNGSRSALVGLVWTPGECGHANQTVTKTFKLHPCYPASENTSPSDDLQSTTKAFFYRTRLAHMTGLDELNLSESSKWDKNYVSVRNTAETLANAIEATMAVLFNTDTARPIKFYESWKNSFAIFCPVDAVSLGPNNKNCLAENGVFISLKRGPEGQRIPDGPWQIDKAELEAILGLWVWSLRNRHGTFSQKAKVSSSRLFRESASFYLDLWHQKNSKKTQRITLQLYSRGQESMEATRQTEANMQNALWWKNGKKFVMKQGFATLEGDVASKLAQELPEPPAEADAIRYFFGLQTLDAPNASTREVNALELTSVKSLIASCAQELYAQFFDAIMRAIKDLGGDSEVKKGRESFHIANESIDRLYTAFTESGLGSSEDVFACIIPVLYMQKKLPSFNNALSEARDVAEEHMSQKKFKQAAELLHWALRRFNSSRDSFSEKEKAETQNEQRLWILTLCECYRYALIEESTRPSSFGYEGILGLLESELPGLRDEKTAFLHIEQSTKSEPPKVEKSSTLAQVLVCYSQAALRFAQDASQTEELRRTTSSIRSTLENSQASGNTDQSACTGTEEQRPESLCSAIQNEDLSSALYLLRRKDSHEEISQGRRALSFAAEKGWLMVVKGLTKAKPDIDVKDVSNRSSLYYAAKGGDINTFRYLLKQGASPNIPDKHGRTALDCAADEDHSVVTQLLLDDPRVDTNPWDESGQTPLLRAARRGAGVVVEQLSRSPRVDSNARDKEYLTPLMIAVDNNQACLVKQLAENSRVNMKLPDRNGRTVLSRAVLCGQAELVRLFLSLDPTLENIRDDLGRTPLSLAVGNDGDAGGADEEDSYDSHGSNDNYEAKQEEGEMEGQTAPNKPDSAVKDSAKNNITLPNTQCDYQHDIISQFLDRDSVDPNTQDANGKTPLSHAVSAGNTEVVKQLLSKEFVDTNIPDKISNTPLALAVTNKADSIVEALLASPKIKPNQGNKFGDNALLLAARLDHVPVVRMLLNHDAVYVDAKNEKGETPLIVACESDHEAVAMLLLAVPNIRVNEATKDGDTALTVAAREGSDAVVKRLLSFEGVQVNTRNNDGDTPLISAAREGWETIVMKLLSVKDIQANARNNDGETPLIAAVQESQDAVVQKLLHHEGILVNARSEPGQTALTAAVKFGRAGIVQMLLNREELDVNQQDEQGQTALALAAETDITEIFQLLLNDRRLKTNAMDTKDNNGNTPLLTAACQGSRHIVMTLVRDSDLDLDLRNNQGRSLLSYTSEQGWADIVSILVSKRNGTCNDRDHDNRDPLSYAAAAKGDSLDSVRILIEKGGFNRSGCDANGRTPISYAAENDCRGVVAYLVSIIESVVDKPDNRGRTPLSYAAGKRHHEVVELLLPHGEVDPDSMDRLGATPLLYAVLEESKANPLKPPVNPMFWFPPGKPDAEVVRVLLDTTKVNPNRRYSEAGYLAIDFAAALGYEMAVRNLLPWVRPRDRPRIRNLLKASRIEETWDFVDHAQLWKHVDDEPDYWGDTLSITPPSLNKRQKSEDQTRMDTRDDPGTILSCAKDYFRAER